jgi:hypothetical protein
MIVQPVFLTNISTLAAAENLKGSEQIAALVMQGEKALWFNNIKLHGHRSKEKGRG